MKIQNGVIATILIVTSLMSAVNADAKGSSGGGSSRSSSSSSRSTSSFGSSKSAPSSSFGSSKSSSSTAKSSSPFSRGPSAATKAVAVNRAQSLNSTSKPMTTSELSKAGVKSTTPQSLGISTGDTAKLSSMQANHNSLQSIPVAQRNSSNPEYVRLEQNYNRDRVVFIQSHPTTYIPVYGSTYGPYDGGQVRYIQPQDERNGFLDGLAFLMKILLCVGLGIGSIYVIVAIIDAVKEYNIEKALEKARKEEEQRRF